MSSNYYYLFISIFVFLTTCLFFQQRDTATLKRAWDNLKAAIRKARALKRGQLNEPVSGAPPPSPPPDPEEIMSMVEEVSCLMNDDSQSNLLILKIIFYDISLYKNH